MSINQHPFLSTRLMGAGHVAVVAHSTFAAMLLQGVVVFVLLAGGVQFPQLTWPPIGRGHLLGALAAPYT